MRKRDEFEMVSVEQASFLTRSACIRLHKFVLGAGLREFGAEPSKLGQDLVHQSYFRGKFMLVDVESQKAAEVA